MFGFYYLHRRWSPDWDNGAPPVSLAAAISSAVVSWFSWPLMVVYLIEDFVKWRLKENERMRELAHRRSKEWNSQQGR